MMRLYLFSLIALTGIAVSGCDTVDSGDIATNALYVTFNVIEDGPNATPQASFRVGNLFGTVLKLTGGDAITANGTTLEFRELLVPHYEATFPVADDYTFTFTRPDEPAYAGTVTPPLPVTITAPAEAATLSQTDGFTVTWTDPDTASTGAYTVGVSVFNSQCLSVVSAGVVNQTTHTFTREDFYPPADEDTKQLCDGATLAAEVFVITYRRGSLDAALDGLVTAETRSGVDITLEP